MRNIKYIVVHCTATPPTATVESIKRFWKDVRGWGDTPGYHYLILRDGKITQLLDESKITYGAYGHNKDSVHVSYIGGIDEKGKPKDNRTDAQKEAMYAKLIELSKKYPKAQILGHRDFPNVAKACPSFDAGTWFRNYKTDFKQAA
jgi:N-acetylmuramoyl-L-alanine amidase